MKEFHGYGHQNQDKSVANFLSPGIIFLEMLIALNDKQDDLSG